MSRSAPISVVETPEFLSASRALFHEQERVRLVDYLARDPTAGDLIPGTGGVRKLRWVMAGRGKRGGARVIYFYHGGDVPLFLLTAYAKSQKADLSRNDITDFRRLTKRLIESYARRKR